MRKKLNSKLLLKKKTISTLNDKINGGNANTQSITIFTVFITKYCDTDKCSANCSDLAHCEPPESQLICRTNNCA